MRNKRQRRKGEGLRVALIAATVFLSLILVCISVFAVFLHRYTGMINYETSATTKSHLDATSIRQEEEEEDDGSEPVVDPTDPIIGDFTPIEQNDNVVNILLIGQDRRPGEGTQRSDSMILVTFNKNTNKITLTSFMRDQYVNIPGYGNDKLCHAYAYGGMPLLNQTLYDHFGVEIDGNIEVDFSGFEDIINILGGVEVDLTAKEAKYLNGLDKDWNLSEGMTRLTGYQALRYSRVRAIDNDYRRAERQRKVLLSLIEEYKGEDLSTTMKLADEFLPLVTTDIPRNQIMSYVMDLFPMLSETTIETLRIPVDGTFTGGYVRVSETRRMWCQYDIDFAANREILRDIFAE